jgi:hypothetical protein
MYEDYRPLIELGRIEEAREMLLFCRSVAQDEHDPALLHDSLCSLSSLELENGSAAVARDFARTALRLAYTCDSPNSVAAGYLHLAVCLDATDAPAAAIVANHLAAFVLASMMTGGTSSYGIALLAELLQRPDLRRAAPSTMEALLSMLETYDAVRYAEMLSRFEKPNVRAEIILHDLIARASR